MRAPLLPLLLLLGLGACTRPASDVVDNAAATPPASSMPAERSPALTHVVLGDTTSDSPFRWEPVAPGPPRTRVDAGELWAPVAPVVAVLRPGATVLAADGGLRVDGELLSVPVIEREGETWAMVEPLARALGGYAHEHPEDGSLALWPAPMLHWLAEHGDPTAPVLAGARESGVLPAAGTPIATLPSRLRIRNEGPADAKALRVRFPDGDIDFGDVAAGATTGYRPVARGVYRYAAYQARLAGRDVDVPVIDWVGESPLPAGDYTYAIAVDPAAALPVQGVRVGRDR